MKPHRTVFTFEYEDGDRARTVERSVRPELGAIDGDRTTASLVREGTTLTLTVEADDLVALRAGCNTWTTLTAVAAAAGGVSATDTL